jgi:hypothetical protein
MELDGSAGSKLLGLFAFFGLPEHEVAAAHRPWLSDRVHDFVELRARGRIEGARHPLAWVRSATALRCGAAAPPWLLSGGQRMDRALRIAAHPFVRSSYLKGIFRGPSGSYCATRSRHGPIACRDLRRPRPNAAPPREPANAAGFSDALMC